MTKAEIVKQVAESVELSLQKTSAAFDTFFSIIAKELKEGRKFQVLGFGTFEVRDRTARKGRNPATGEQIEIVPNNLWREIFDCTHVVIFLRLDKLILLRAGTPAPSW